tara:strand:+ start:16918 stop:18228 length:1311 start_codon:yes stop_codon:yes gene_type:complete
MSATFNKIKEVDKSKLEGNALKAYNALKEETDNFDLDTAVALNLDDDVERLARKIKEKFPQALKEENPIKKAVVKRQAEAKKKKEAAKKKPKKKAKKKSKPKSSSSKTGSFAKLRSQIAKREGISYKDALSLAKKEYAEAKKEAAAQDSQKRGKRLEKFIKKYDGKGLRKDVVDAEKDAKQPALPEGKRTSKNGKIYYEYRDNRTDQRQPQPTDYPRLNRGGDVAAAEIIYPTEIIKGIMAKGGEITLGEIWEKGESIKEVMNQDDGVTITYKYKSKEYKIRNDNEGDFISLKGGNWEDNQFDSNTTYNEYNSSYAKGGKLSDKKMKRGASKEYYGYFRGYRPNTTQYMLLDDNYAAIVTKYRNSDSIDDYDIYDDKFQFRGSASGIKQGESGKQKVSLRKADFEKAKSFKDLYTNKKRDMSMAMMRAKGGNITHE